MPEIQIKELDLDPACQWKSLTRYAAHEEAGVLFVRRGAEGSEEYSQASYVVPEVHPRFPALWCGLSASIVYHHGRCCYMLERHYTAPWGKREQAGENAWFDLFDEAIAALLERPSPAGRGLIQQ